MFPVTVIVRTEKGRFEEVVEQPSREAMAEAIARLYGEHEGILALWAETTYVDQGEEGTFTVVAEDANLPPEENAASMWEELKGFRY